MDRFIDTDRMRRRLDSLWEIGKTNQGGVTRLAYSDEETAAIEYVLDELPDAYHVTRDPIGNVFATWDPASDRSLIVGSHLDTVFNGGRLDGTVGIVGGMEAIEAVRSAEDDPPAVPTLAIFRAEESARFGQHTIGSRGALGLLTVEDFSAVDQNDIPLWQAMQRAGFQPSDLSEPTIDLDGVRGYLEAHIEQGRVLDETDANVGVVTSIRAPVRYRATVTGEYDHSGATPMGLRRDAVAGTAEMITTIESVGDAAAEDGDVVATVGDITAHEGAINTVCGKVSFPVDIRSNDAAYRDEVEADVTGRMASIADRRELTIELEELDRSCPVSLDRGVVNRLESAAESAEVAYRCLPSGGGHDAMNFQSVGIPTGMVFVPSIDGVSHNPLEETPDVAIRDATELLARVIGLGPPGIDDE